MLIRPAVSSDHAAIWSILEPTIRAGETYTLPRDMTREAALAYWLASTHETFVAENDAGVLGTYYLRPNQQGGGAHVANAGFMTAHEAAGRGIARAMCAHALAIAPARGYRAMQFNFVVSTNIRAIKLWESFGFETLCRIPRSFHHPRAGYVDALMMFREF